MWNFQRSWFLGLKFQEGCNIHNLTKFPGVELYKVFFGFEISKGYNIHSFTKFSGMEFCPQPPPCCVFSSGVVHSKVTDLNWSYEALSQKEALTVCEDRAFASVSCVLSLSSILVRKVYSVLWYQLSGERSTPAWEAY